VGESRLENTTLGPGQPGRSRGGYAWCAAFAVAMCEEGGRPVRKSASVRRLLQLNRDLEVDDLQPGDLLIHLSDDGNRSRRLLHPACERQDRDDRWEHKRVWLA
jgi:hypothetical protein